MKTLRIAAVSAITTVGMVAGLAAPVAAHGYNGGWRSSHGDRGDYGCAQAWRAVKRADRWLDPTIDTQRERFQSAINAVNDQGCEARGDVVDVLMESGQFSTLVGAVSEAGLVDTLKGGEFTIFAPTDEAFAKIPADTLNAVVQDKALLASILTYHVLAGKVDAATAQTVNSAMTVNGKAVMVSMHDGGLFINDSRVTLYDIPATNGVVHVIDTVLMP